MLNTTRFFVQMRWRVIGGFLSTLFNRFFDDQCSTYAASLAYTTLLSIVPLLLFIFHILSYFPQLKTAGAQIESFAIQNFVASSASTISVQLQTFISHMKILSWMSIISLAVISLLLIFNIVSAINAVWHVNMKKYLALSFILYFCFVLIAPILLTVLLLLSSYLMSLPFLSDAMHFALMKKPLFFIFPILIEWIAFSFFHWVIPSCRVQLRFAMIAGLLTTGLFEIAKWGFVQYLYHFPTYQLVYGALATIPILLVWIYLSWVIVILSALVCNLLQTRVYITTNP